MQIKIKKEQTASETGSDQSLTEDNESNTHARRILYKNEPPPPPPLATSNWSSNSSGTNTPSISFGGGAGTQIGPQEEHHVRESSSLNAGNDQRQMAFHKSQITANNSGSFNSGHANERPLTVQQQQQRQLQPLMHHTDYKSHTATASKQAARENVSSDILNRTFHKVYDEFYHHDGDEEVEEDPDDLDEPGNFTQYHDAMENLGSGEIGTSEIKEADEEEQLYHREGRRGSSGDKVINPI